MFMVVMTFSEDVFVDADDYEVDEDGDLVFSTVREDDDGEDISVETGRFKEDVWAAVLEVEPEEDEDTDEGGA